MDNSQRGRKTSKKRWAGGKQYAGSHKKSDKEVRRCGRSPGFITGRGKTPYREAWNKRRGKKNKIKESGRGNRTECHVEKVPNRPTAEARKGGSAVPDRIRGTIRFTKLRNGTQDTWVTVPGNKPCLLYQAGRARQLRESFNNTRRRNPGRTQQRTGHHARRGETILFERKKQKPLEITWGVAVRSRREIGGITVKKNRATNRPTPPEQPEAVGGENDCLRNAKTQTSRRNILKTHWRKPGKG